MAFHPVDRSLSYGALTQPAERRISARVEIANGKRRIAFRMTRDAANHLGVGVGDFVLPLLGSDEDFGSFAVQRANRESGYKLASYNSTRMLTFGLAASRFMPFPDKTTVHFRCEFETEPRRVIARPAVVDTPTSRVNITASRPLTFA